MTTANHTATWVEATREGDLSAFSQLVAQHQGAAFGYALAQLRDVAAAEDAVQEAFVDAYLNLGQLREPAAFAGWLRRIVFKHCDRQRRKTRPVAVAEPPEVTSDDTPDAMLDEERRRARLGDAIERLPEHERFVVALHYLAGQPVKAIGALLSLSPSAVKKRLFSARRRIRQEDLMLAPTPIPTFEHRVALFLAVRSGDRDHVRRILAAEPELLEAEETWSDEEALAGGFTLAHRVTPLVLAAGYGDLPMVELLLELGASPDGRCGCDNGETALWAAARAGHEAVADTLRRAGAAETPNQEGYTPEALTRWRETPHPSVAALTDTRVTTGLKALDLWLPLEPGAIVRVHGAAETGLTVLLSEISGAIGRAGGAVVWSSWEPRPWHRLELDVLARRSGLDGLVAIETARSREGRDGVLRRSFERLASSRTDRPFTAHVIFEQEGRQSDVEAAFPQLGQAAAVTFVVRPWAAVTRGEAQPPGDGPHDACLCTDPRLAAQWLYPAVDPQQTRSRYEASEVVARARALVGRYAEVDPTLRDPACARARRLLAYLTQPFACAEPDTGWPVVAVSAEHTLRDVEAILDGAADAMSEEQLRYRGALEG